ncbi:hypothetical protein BDAP_000351 [Binucleata daphniae]
MQLISFFFFCNLVKQELLTYNQISKQLNDIAVLFKKKQEEWFQKNINNELVLINYVKETRFKKLIQPIIEKYLEETENTSVYVVSFEKLTYNALFGFNTISLAKYASEIIEICVKTNKPYKQTRYGLEWECWKIASKNDYEKLKIQIDRAEMLYIDGFYDGYDSYEEFISHYLFDNEFLNSLDYKIVINLQKAVENETTYIDVEKLCKKLRLIYSDPIKIIKFNNHLGFRTFNGEVLNAPIAVCYEMRDANSTINTNVSDVYWDNMFSMFKYMQKVEYKQKKNTEELEHWKYQAFKDLDLKMIQLDEIEMRRFYASYSITFLTFVKKREQEIKTIQDEGVNQHQEVDYEMVIITMINLGENKFQHVTTYPVCDADGERPITNYDTEDEYYKRLCAQHDKLQSMLDVIHNTFLNDCIIDDQKSLLLHNLLDLKNDYLRRYVKMTDLIKLKDSEVSIHDQNVEFIKKLQLKFGAKINIELYNIEHNTKNFLYLFNSGWDYDFLAHHSYKNKIDVKAYLEGKHDNIDVAMMIIHITNTKKSDSTYYFVHNTYTKQDVMERLESYISENNQKLCTELKNRTVVLEALEHK